MKSQNNLIQILEAQIRKDKQTLFEASLSRIMQHVQQAKDEGFALLTSWRQANDKQTNLGNFQQLKNLIRKNGLGFLQLKGHWQECQTPDVPYDQCKPEDLIDSIEPSLMVFKIDLNTAKGLGNMFDQDAVVYAGPETDGQAQLHFKNGETITLGQFDPMAIGQAFSEFRSKEDGSDKSLPRVQRTFKFEGMSYPAQSNVEKMTEEQLNKNLSILKEGLKELRKQS